MLLFAGLPFVLSAVLCALLVRRVRRVRRTDKHKKESGGKSGDIAQWVERNKMSLTLGAAFLLMLIIAAGVGLICIKLSASVQIYYLICGATMGAVAGAAMAMLTPPDK